nr:MAG TPA: hypothetical protein [Caudoviricetes sp.]
MSIHIQGFSENETRGHRLKEGSKGGGKPPSAGQTNTPRR